MGTSSITTAGRGFFGWTATWSLVDHDPTVLDQLAAPDSPWLGPLDRAARRNLTASEHLLQMALARAMSSGVSEKNRWVRVPWPSAQRGRGARTATGSTSSANSLSMSMSMCRCFG